MRDLSPHAFDRTGRGRLNRSTVRLLCPNNQRMPAWRSCWFRHLTWCRRRRPRRRPREPGRVPDAQWSRTHCPMTPRRTPPTKTRRRKERFLPQQGRKEKEGRPNWGGRRVEEREDPPYGLLHQRRRRRRGVATQGQAPGKIGSIRIP